jgi:hypothetical protein
MGRMQALEVGHYADNLDQALRWHLRSNHYPPITLALLPVAKKAIEIANEAIAMDDEDLWQTMIYVPTADKKLSVSKIIEGMHLDSFLDAVQEDVYEDEYHPPE